MDKKIFTVISNEEIAQDVFRLVLGGDAGTISAPGQFVNIKIDGMYLRRPISVCDHDDSTLTLVFRHIGAGTDRLASQNAGDPLDLLIPLGNGFDIAPAGDRPLIIGGGIGTPPLYSLAKTLIAAGKAPTVLLGFNSSREVILENEFRSLGGGISVKIATADGSYGEKGYVTALLEKVADYTYFYACGPKVMYKPIHDIALTDGQFSLEERMGCGFGACMGCTCKTKNGPKRVCKEGPVFRGEELEW